MAKKNLKVKVDTINGLYKPEGTIKQLDSVFFNIEVTEEGEKKDLTGQTIKLFARKSDGKMVEQSSGISITNAEQGELTIDLLNAAVQAPGYVYFELEISDNNGIISTADFVYKVMPKVGSDEAIESTNEVSTLKKVEAYIKKAEAELTEFDGIFTEAKREEEKRQEAEKQRGLKLKEIEENKYDNVELSGNSLKFYAKNTIKKSITLNVGTGGSGGSNLIIRDIEPGEIFTINSNTVESPIIPVQSITLNQTTLNLKKGNTYKLEAAIHPVEATDKTLNWSSSRDEIATVKNGEVTAIETGVCDITVSSNSGDVTAKCKVTVVEANNEIVNVNTISLNKKTHTMKVDETVNLTFTIDPPNATNQKVTWEANNQNCIVENGLVTAKTKGECIITVRTQEGNKTDTCTITIEEKEAVEPVEFTNCLYNTDTFNSPSHLGTYWQNYKCTKNVESGIATLLFNTPNAGFFLCRPNIADNNKYYYRLLVRTSDIPHLKVTKSGVTLEGKNLGDWTLFSVVDVDKSTTTTLRIEDTRQEGFTEIKTKEWMKINLTEIYGSGNEPTKENCDSVFTIYKTGLTG